MTLTFLGLIRPHTHTHTHVGVETPGRLHGQSVDRRNTIALTENLPATDGGARWKGLALDATLGRRAR